MLLSTKLWGLHELGNFTSHIVGVSHHHHSLITPLLAEVSPPVPSSLNSAPRSLSQTAAVPEVHVDIEKDTPADIIVVQEIEEGSEFIYLERINVEKEKVVRRETPSDDIYVAHLQEFQSYLDECIPEPKPWLDPSTKEYILDGMATGIGTAFWMLVYYLQDYFDFGGLAGYLTLGLLMGIISNLVALPFVYLGGRVTGFGTYMALRIMIKYFFACLFPDSAYELNADLFIALAQMDQVHPDNSTGFEFVPYANPQFTWKEILLSWAFLGITFGLTFYGVKKKFFKDEEEDESNEFVPNTQTLSCLRRTRHFFEGPSGDAVKVTGQYETFYGDDYFFDTDWEQGLTTWTNLFYASSIMGIYSTVSDYAFHKLGQGARNLEHRIYNHQMIPLENGKWTYRKDYIPLKDDWVIIDSFQDKEYDTVEEKETQLTTQMLEESSSSDRLEGNDWSRSSSLSQMSLDGHIENTRRRSLGSSSSDILADFGVKLGNFPLEDSSDDAEKKKVAIAILPSAPLSPPQSSTAPPDLMSKLNLPFFADYAGEDKGQARHLEPFVYQTSRWCGKRS